MVTVIAFDFYTIVAIQKYQLTFYTCHPFFQWLLVWCFTLVLNNHNHQPKQPQIKTALFTVEM